MNQADTEMKAKIEANLTPAPVQPTTKTDNIKGFPDPVFIADYIPEYLKYLETVNEFDGVLTGFDEIDSEMKGFRGITILAGTPKTGKTTLAVQMAVQSIKVQKEKAKENIFVLFYSFELSKAEILNKIVSYYGFITRNEILKHGADKQPDGVFTEISTQKGKIDKALNEIKESLKHFTIRSREEQAKSLDDFTILKKDIAFLKAKAEQTGEPFRILCIIDHIQMMRIDPNAIKNKSTVETEIILMDKLQETHQEHDKYLSFLCISQLKKDSFSGTPTTADELMESVKGSVNITYLATNIMFMKSLKTIKIKKADTGGKDLTAKVLYIGFSSRYSGLDEIYFYLLNAFTQRLLFLGSGELKEDGKKLSILLSQNGKNHYNALKQLFNEIEQGRYSNKENADKLKSEFGITDIKTYKDLFDEFNTLLYSKENKNQG